MPVGTEQLDKYHCNPAVTALSLALTGKTQTTKNQTPQFARANKSSSITRQFISTLFIECLFAKMERRSLMLQSLQCHGSEVRRDVAATTRQALGFV